MARQLKDEATSLLHLAADVIQITMTRDSDELLDIYMKASVEETKSHPKWSIAYNGEYLVDRTKDPSERSFKPNK